MAITLHDALSAAHELATGTQRPSVKVALWAALLSAQSSLENNAEQLERLRPFARTGLPQDPQELYALMKGTQNFWGAKCRGLYYIEKLEREGKLIGLEHIGDTYAEQCAWRKRVYTLAHGHGLGWKTISFAAGILSPLTCELVPVDRHVLARFGYQTDRSPSSWCKYQPVEQQVLHERDQEHYHEVPLFIWHWLKWENWRQATGASTATHGAQSHATLSCRVW